MGPRTKGSSFIWGMFTIAATTSVVPVAHT
jgi:hypothetical protein